MAVVTPIEGLISLEFNQKFGLPNGFGFAQFGWTPFGEDNERAGYYQTRPRKEGRILVKMRHYWPVDNPDPATIIRRGLFADGVAAWQALDAGEKQYYNELQYPESKSGFNRFMSLWLRGVIS